MGSFELLTQEKLKRILIDVKQQGENLLIEDAIDMINELKKQILASITPKRLGA
ncbi:hypothetical protein [Fictibacillus barbaricus]|uniref:Spo0E like sporulation regulatory protein n=1 Tax=Fictibacillus barbaricus TaxID=182136 RepID=A0ABU1U1K9_9BACL|nr:hypothetical protein [Fictibacillus barbaricus]MDR7073359.1 hypothetical protein [Fictibacillus barbaricus]